MYVILFNMVQAADKKKIIAQLQGEILSMQGLRDSSAGKLRLGLEVLEQAFPNQTFPVAAVHEFLSYGREEAAATNSFMSCLLNKLMPKDGYCIWVAVRRSIYPPALKRFGIDADRIVFVDAVKNVDALWVIEEALKCDQVAAVVGEVPDLNFTESRRLQLAVESSKVTGLIHRCYPRQENTVACVSRWHIKPVPSQMEDGLPGVGFPQWEVHLSKVRNGHPGTWLVEWAGSGFAHVKPAPVAIVQDLQTGLYG
jgi:protein ImuA